ncbi:molecular chaperone TorD [Shewanella sp. WXL01]|uniref:Molecular chaperone TorD n=1 Tax=Shewanella maritima TaxID=2520507 RepID=A0A411PIS4_9GAMM|nr:MULTISPECIES: molecular chaperone TorD family protein [Shewanella]NKF52802.1 molecular chaperone TorD [Shewanella sp. WXL01]QBF83384.1 molecular chaperone TorD [Shewanella maritima]
MSNQQTLLELQAISRLLHNLLIDYPTQESIEYLIEHQIAQQWPDLTSNQHNKTGKLLLEAYLASWTPEQLNQTKLDYGQLYFGPGEPKAMPWGSVYLGEQGILNDDSTIKLMDFYKQQGVSFELKHQQPVDHIALFYAVIDQLLEVLLTPQTQSGSENDSENDSHAAERTLCILLQQHLLTWSGRCHELAQQHAQTDFYRAIAMLATDFEQVLASALNVVPVSQRLFR